MAEKQIMESSEEANIRKINIAKKMAEKWIMESAEEAKIRKSNNTENMDNKQRLETPQQHQKGLRKYMNIMDTEKMEIIDQIGSTEYHYKMNLKVKFQKMKER
jgi:hypothetical protein